MKNIKWNEVTWYSKLGAVVLFLIVVPVITFYIGMQYQSVLSIKDYKPEEVVIKHSDIVKSKVTYTDYATSSPSFNIAGNYPVYRVGESKDLINQNIKKYFDFVVSSYIAKAEKDNVSTIVISSTSTESLKYNSASVLFEAFITGDKMAHPALERFAITFDTKTGKLKSPEDVLGVSKTDFLSKLSKASQYVFRHDTKYGVDLTSSGFVQGVSEKLDNFGKVMLGENTLQVFFDEYQLGDRPVGAPVVELTYSSMGL